GNSSGIAGADRRVRQIELWRVEGVEEFGAELEIQTFRDAELLEEREIEIHPPRAVKNIAARIAVGELRRRRERRRVEPAVNCRIVQFAVASAIRTAASAGVDRRRIGRRRERQARLKSADAINLPAAERVLSRAAAAQPFTPFAERQRVIPGD